MNELELKDFARFIRISSLKMTSRGGSSHIGSALSIADILAVLYGSVLNYRVEDPSWIERDRFILSKGHAGVAVYAALAYVGFFEREKLKQHYQNGSIFSGHLSHKSISGVELSTGSLGHGMGVAAGIAYGLKQSKISSKVIAVLSDGECDEGTTWEAALFAQHHQLTNLIIIIDYNKIQSLDFVSKTLKLEPFQLKWESFNWNVIEVDGHDVVELLNALSKKSEQFPTIIIAHTTKGKGVSFMENSVLWHYRCARDKEFDEALAELEDNP